MPCTIGLVCCVLASIVASAGSVSSETKTTNLRGAHLTPTGSAAHNNATSACEKQWTGMLEEFRARTKAIEDMSAPGKKPSQLTKVISDLHADIEPMFQNIDRNNCPEHLKPLIEMFENQICDMKWQGMSEDAQREVAMNLQGHDVDLGPCTGHLKEKVKAVHFNDTSACQEQFAGMLEAFRARKNAIADTSAPGKNVFQLEYVSTEAKARSDFYADMEKRLGNIDRKDCPEHTTRQIEQFENQFCNIKWQGMSEDAKRGVAMKLQRHVDLGPCTGHLKEDVKQMQGQQGRTHSGAKAGTTVIGVGIAVMLHTSLIL